MSNQIAVRFEAVFGVVQGYGHDNGLTAGLTAGELVAHAWRLAMDADHTKVGFLCPATVTAGRVVYATEWGCPETGEVVATVVGNSHPKVHGDRLAEYREAVLRIVADAKRRLGQSRVQVTFTEIASFGYFEPEGEGGEQRWGC